VKVDPENEVVSKEYEVLWLLYFIFVTGWNRFVQVGMYENLRTCCLLGQPHSTLWNLLLI
jgi:hypothetical protein